MADSALFDDPVIDAAAMALVAESAEYALGQALSRIAALEAERARLRAALDAGETMHTALVRLEWRDWMGDRFCCPYCGGSEKLGHERRCLVGLGVREWEKARAASAALAGEGE